LEGKKIGVEGVGKVGSWLVKLLCQENAIVYVTDICPKQLETITASYKVEVVHTPEHLYSMPLDIYAPCALGATLNGQNIAKMDCSIIVGAANNQLACEERDGRLLLEKGILYLPDFLVNAGGIINAATELDKGFFNKKNLVKEHTEQLYYLYICLDVLDRAEQQKLPTQNIAKEIALERIQSVRTTWCH